MGDDEESGENGEGEWRNAKAASRFRRGMSQFSLSGKDAVQPVV